MKRAYLFIVGCLSTLLFHGPQVASGQDKEATVPPNIILIMADDLGYGELGCYGQDKIRTPNIDRLSREGMRFSQFYTAAPVCAPARCSLVTGMHGGHAYVRDNQEVGSWDSFRGQLPIRESDTTIAELLKQAGYATGAFGKWGLGEVGSTGDPLNKGFDRFFGYNCQRHAHNYYPRYLISDTEKVELEGNDRGATGAQYAPKLIADELLTFIHDHQNEPFFAYYPTIIPHLALQVPKQELQPYLNEGWNDPPYTGNSYQPHPTPKAAYAAMISYLDKQVGRILDLLEELDLAENTILIFTSDNGTTHLKAQVDDVFFQSVGPLRGLKGSVYEGGIRVPLIARWPNRILEDSTSSLPATLYDMMATLCELAGVDPPQSDGISFLPTLLAQANQQRRHSYLFWDFGGYGGQVAIRVGKWKAVKRNLRKNPDAPLELYDLENDISESQDVASEHPEKCTLIEQLILEVREEPEIDKFRYGRYE